MFKRTRSLIKTTFLPISSAKRKTRDAIQCIKSTHEKLRSDSEIIKTRSDHEAKELFDSEFNQYSESEIHNQIKSMKRNYFFLIAMFAAFAVYATSMTSMISLLAAIGITLWSLAEAIRIAFVVWMIEQKSKKSLTDFMKAARSNPAILIPI